jgi:hypothetical protein
LLTNKAQTMEKSKPFVPLAVLENALLYWWVIAVVVVAGGLTGLLFNALRPAVYEATAQFSIAIDYVSTGPLTQYSEDLAINTAGNLFRSTEVLERVVSAAASEGVERSLGDFKAQTALERKFSVWTMRVRDQDPKTAELLARLWLQEGEAALQQSYQHALQAYVLERYIQSQEICLAKVGSGEPLQESCTTARFVEIQENIRDAGLMLFKERQASRGLFAGLTLGPFNPPVLPERPVLYGRNQSVLVGAMLGLLLGIALVETGAVRIFRKKK